MKKEVSEKELFETVLPVSFGMYMHTLKGLKNVEKQE